MSMSKRARRRGKGRARNRPRRKDLELVRLIMKVLPKVTQTLCEWVQQVMAERPPPYELPPLSNMDRIRHLFRGPNATA